MAKTSKSLSTPLDRFTRAVEAPRFRIIGASFGEVGTGKTHWWLGAPGPIVVFSFDQGLEGVVEQFQADKDIRIVTYQWDPTVGDSDAGQDEAKAIRDQFTEDFEFAVQHARTVLWDKETLIWELFRYAEFGAPNDAPRNYPELNKRYRRLVQLPKATTINFGCIQGMKDRWETRTKKDGSGTQGFNTGSRVRSGFSELDELVFFDLMHTRQESTFSITVGKAHGPGARDLQDTQLDDVSFADFGRLAFPDSDESDWT